jgi:peptidase E
MLTDNGGNLDILAKRAKYGKIVAAASASAVASFPSDGTSSYLVELVPVHLDW